MPDEASSVFRRRLGHVEQRSESNAQRRAPAESASDRPRNHARNNQPDANQAYTAHRNTGSQPNLPESTPHSGDPYQDQSTGYRNPEYTNSSRPYTAAYPVSAGQAPRLPHPDWLDSAQARRLDNGLEATISHTLSQWRGRAHALFSDQVAPVRIASHFSVLVVAAFILIISQLDMPDWQFTLRALPTTGFLGANAGEGGSAMGAFFATDSSGAVLSAGESLQRAAVPFTVPNARNAEASGPVASEAASPGAGAAGVIQKYIVQSGDTVLGIAERFGLQPETIQWANSTLEINPDLIRPGDELNILPVNGVLHTIRAGDTLSSIAHRYSVSVDDIIGYTGNGLPSVSASLSVGQELIIPDGTKPQAQAQAVAYTATTAAAPSNAQVGSGNFVWPSSGPINQRYWSGHPAIDVGGWTGSPVRAADGGYVAVARGGWNGGYGNHVIIDHGNGFVTLYAHLNSIFVKPGESVSRGQQVGSVGNTGNSTGPHLHFEIRYQGVARNPLSYLP